MDDAHTQSNTNDIVIPSEIRGYLQSLLNDAGMQDLDNLLEEEMMKELFVRLDQYITSVIVDNMPSEYLEEFVQLHEAGKTQKEIEAYIRDHMPNAQDVLRQAFMDFRDEYLGNIALSKKVLPTKT